MGFWDRFRGVNSYDPAQRVLPDPYEPFISTGGIPVMDPGTPLEFWRNGERSQVEHFWRTQPNVRKVVDFIARNAAIPMHAYERVSDTDRRRLSGEPLTRVLGSPRKGIGSFRFWHSVLSDGLLYDRWCILKDYTSSGELELVQVPSWRLRLDVDPLRRVTGLRYWAGDDGTLTGDDAWIPIGLDEAIFDYGYAPRSAGLSPIETLRDILDESAEAVAYRRQVWKNGARVPGYISRPEGKAWTPEQRDRFVAGMQSYTRDGDMAGRLPLLEDGMKIEDREVFTPQDANDLEGRRLTAIECAAAWHIAPELVGAQQGNYSNVREYRQMLYRDSLGPYIWPIEQALNAQLVPELARGRSIYVEANIESKLRGSFEEQAQIMQSAVGAPWTTRNEARARMNMPPIEGGDDIVTPLNVLTGGQASPSDSGTQNLNAAPQPRSKARAPETHETKHAEVLADFFNRQARVIKSRIGAGEDWWDGERWDDELGTTLLSLYLLTSKEAAERALDALGLSDYDVDRTMAFLKESATRSAHEINTTTQADVTTALADDAPADAVANVFEVAAESRSSQIATTAVSFASGFATIEVARQNVGEDGVTKTWRTTSGNPRASHAALDGETVGVNDVFSNGLRWPGGAGDPAESAGCKCEMDINF
jgi:HK97 family phage portal protein